MANLYHLDKLPDPGEAELTGATAHHLLRVVRVRPDDLVTLCDGRGRTASATVLRADRASLRCRISAAIEHAPVTPRVTLAFASPRPSRADWLIEHATEVGVATFQPIWTARSRPQSMRLERWRKIAAAAAGQCARAHQPEIRQPIELRSFLRSPLPATRLLADAAGPRHQDAAPAEAAVVLVGPEGGLTVEEADQAVARGFQRLCLGPHILRTETAALVGAAALLRAAAPLS